MANFSLSIVGFHSAKNVLMHSFSRGFPALWKGTTKINSSLPSFKPSAKIMRYFSSKLDEKEPKMSESQSKEVSPDESNLKGKVTAIMKKYGVIAVTTYFSLYLCTLGSIFFVLDFDIINASSVGFDPVETIKKVTYSTVNTFVDLTSCNIGM